MRVRGLWVGALLGNLTNRRVKRPNVRGGIVAIGDPGGRDGDACAPSATPDVVS